MIWYKSLFRSSISFSMVCLISAVTIGDVFAASSEAKSSKTASEKGEALEKLLPTHIQMYPMMLPVGRTTVPMTFILEAARTTKKSKSSNVEKICNQIPFIRDAVLRVLSREPIPVKRRKIILKGVAERILKPINKAIELTYIKNIFITPGVVKFGKGKVKNRPFAVIDNCVNILRSERERKQAEKAAKEK